MDTSAFTNDSFNYSQYAGPQYTHEDPVPLLAPDIPQQRPVALAAQPVDDQVYTKRKGNRREVMDGIAHHTSGGLVRDDLMYNKRGRIVSKKRHELGKKMFKQNNLQPRTK